MRDTRFERDCEQCGAAYYKLAHEAIFQFNGRRFCSQKCWQNSRITPEKPHPNCANCGGPVIRRPKESNAKFHIRKFCEADCRKEFCTKALADWLVLKRDGPRGWPELTGSNLRGRPFAVFDCDPGDGGPLRVYRKETLVVTEANS